MEKQKYFNVKTKNKYLRYITGCNYGMLFQIIYLTSYKLGV